ncbi:unnamed protein product [Prorocentrum cordatum]|uniref:Pre-mRNA-splicing factor 38 n=1 Tax=Prorocentrum cordatum TaxID=2364126 RepID=A0ABN9Q874_9DINO|nr:unnamed protein product [Polarella glacialis]
MECLNYDTIPFADIMCQMNDMISPEFEGHFRLTDFKKKRKFAGIFFSLFSSLNKFLAFEHRDPFLANAGRSRWTTPASTIGTDRWCADEYLRLAMEENEEPEEDGRGPQQRRRQLTRARPREKEGERDGGLQSWGMGGVAGAGSARASPGPLSENARAPGGSYIPPPLTPVASCCDLSLSLSALLRSAAKQTVARVFAHPVSRASACRALPGRWEYVEPSRTE